MSVLRALVSSALVCVLLVAPGHVTAQDASIASSGPDPTVLRAIETQVSQLRGLTSRAEVNLRVIDQAGLQQYLLDAFERDYLPSERESDQKEFVALGLIKPTDDLVQMQLQLLQGQVIGVYDPDDKLMFIVDSQGGFGPAERVTYAHEFNHALQDQHYDLNRVAPKHPLTNDRSLAAHAVVEGDAVLLQTLWAAGNLTQDDLIALARIPLVVRTELLFPYVEGFNFVRQAYRESGNSFAAIDELLKNPPESTAQIMHPDKYKGGARPVDVELPDLANALGSDWRRVGGGVLGELDVRVLLEQYGDRAEANRVAAGWNGDRWILVEKEGRSTIVLKTSWQSDVAAQEFFSAYKRGLRARFDSATTEEDSEMRQALTTPTAATDMRLRGQEVLAVIAFDRQSANAVIAALTASGL
jgi:hypothetical protein